MKNAKSPATHKIDKSILSLFRSHKQVDKDDLQRCKNIEKQYNQRGKTLLELRGGNKGFISGQLQERLRVMKDRLRVMMVYRSQPAECPFQSSKICSAKGDYERTAVISFSYVV